MILKTWNESCHLTWSQDLFSSFQITEDDVKAIRALSADERIAERVFKSIAPSIYGHHDVKVRDELYQYRYQCVELKLICFDVFSFFVFVFDNEQRSRLRCRCLADNRRTFAINIAFAVTSTCSYQVTMETQCLFVCVCVFVDNLLKQFFFQQAIPVLESALNFLVFDQFFIEIIFFSTITQRQL